MRILEPAQEKDYNLVWYLTYMLYAPLYLAGPIVTFNDFVSQVQKQKKISSFSLAFFSIYVFIFCIYM